MARGVAAGGGGYDSQPFFFPLLDQIGTEPVMSSGRETTTNLILYYDYGTIGQWPFAVSVS